MAMKIHHWLFRWILNANKPTDGWSRWEESRLPRTRIARAITDSASFTIVSSWVSKIRCCERWMIRTMNRVWEFGNQCPGMWEVRRSECGSKLFDLDYRRTTSVFVNSRIGVSIIFNHIFSFQFTWGALVIFSTWTDCSYLWKEKQCSCWWRKNNVDMCRHQNRINYQFRQPTTLDEYFVFQNETLLCWILWMSASTYSSANVSEW